MATHFENIVLLILKYIFNLLVSIVFCSSLTYLFLKNKRSYRNILGPNYGCGVRSNHFEIGLDCGETLPKKLSNLIKLKIKDG